MSEVHTPEVQKFYRMDDVCDLTGCSRSTIYELIERGQFPRGVKIAPKAVAWPAADIAAWQADRIAARNQAA